MSTDAVLGLILGWSLGLISGPLAEHIRRGHRRKELKAALCDELREFRQLMASVVYLLRNQLGTVDRNLIQRILVIQGRSHLRRPSDEATQELEAQLRLTDEDLRRRGRNKVRDGLSLSLKLHRLPLLDIAIPELTLFSPHIRGRLLDIREKVDLWNQDVPHLMDLNARTFDSALTTQNRQVVIQNLESGYERLAERGLLIADRIGELLEEW